MRLVALFACMLAALLALAGPAAAQTATQVDTDAVQEAIDTLSGGDPVYVHPDARDQVPESQEEGLEEDVARAGGDIYLAVFPAEVGLADSVAGRIADEVGRSGTYAVVAGSRSGRGLALSAGSDQLQPGVAQRLAGDAARDSGSVSEGLARFVTSVEEARANGGRYPGGSGGGGGFLGFLALLAIGFGAFSLLRGRRRRQEHRQQLEEVRNVARDDLMALGTDIRALDLDIEMPGVSATAKQRYGEAVEAYTQAGEAMDRARDPRDFEPIGKLLEEGRYDIAAARAELEGREAPERRPPCFFDPRHGPSVTEVEWAPYGGEPRPVPVCAADAVRLEEGEEPMSREIVAHGQRMPYWQAPGQFAPFYAGGMFGGFGGLATGLLFGSMLGGMYGAGDAWAGGGGFGGGDFGGGDFGGGSFGGGDFGGGGFGGGDF